MLQLCIRAKVSASTNKINMLQNNWSAMLQEEKANRL